MSVVEMLVIGLGASGLWKFGEAVFKYWTNRNKQKVEEENIIAETQNYVVDNLKDFCNLLEKKCDALEEELCSYKEQITELHNIIKKYKEKVRKLEEKLSSLFITNAELKEELRVAKKGCYDN
jgi:uncharacterized coiled-coil DUF342 family protein